MRPVPNRGRIGVCRAMSARVLKNASSLPKITLGRKTVTLSNAPLTVKPPFYVLLPDRVSGTGGRVFKA